MLTICAVLYSHTPYSSSQSSQMARITQCHGTIERSLSHRTTWGWRPLEAIPIAVRMHPSVRCSCSQLTT
jgi:hypothetical protein